MDYFSDRDNGSQNQINTEISELLWAAIYLLIQGRLEDHSFGYAFPENCADGYGPCGCDKKVWVSITRRNPTVTNAFRIRNNSAN